MKPITKVATTVVLLAFACMFRYVHQSNKWEKEGKLFIMSLSNELCVAYTVNSPAYTENVGDKIGCKQYNFKYIPQNKTHAPHFGKVYWGIQIAESSYNGTVVYFDWDVMPSNFSARALPRNESLLLARDSRNITTNWFSFNYNAKEFLKKWMSHTNSPRDYGWEDQYWIHAELGSTDYDTIEVRRVVKGHCHHNLINRNICVKSMYGHSPTHIIPLKVVAVSETVSTIVLITFYNILSRSIYVLVMLIESAARTMWLQKMLQEKYVLANELMGIGDSVECPEDLKQLWDKPKNKPKVPFDRIFVGSAIIETKAAGPIILVSNGSKIIRCIKKQKKLTYKYYLALSCLFSTTCVIAYIMTNAKRRTLPEIIIPM